MSITRIPLDNAVIYFDSTKYQPQYTHETFDESHRTTAKDLKDKKRQKKIKQKGMESITTSEHGALTHKDYNSSGYSRGHMVNVGNHTYSVASFKKTLKMYNICPQKEKFNNSKGLWGLVESDVKSMIQRLETNDLLDVFSGPIFLDGTTATIGGKVVPIASHFFKVTFLNQQPHKCWIVEHIEDQHLDHNDFQVDLSAIEKTIEINFTAIVNPAAVAAMAKGAPVGSSSPTEEDETEEAKAGDGADQIGTDEVSGDEGEVTATDIEGNPIAENKGAKPVNAAQDVSEQTDADEVSGDEAEVTPAGTEEEAGAENKGIKAEDVVQDGAEQISTDEVSEVEVEGASQDESEVVLDDAFKSLVNIKIIECLGVLQDKQMIELKVSLEKIEECITQKLQSDFEGERTDTE